MAYSSIRGATYRRNLRRHRSDYELQAGEEKSSFADMANVVDHAKEQKGPHSSPEISLGLVVVEPPPGAMSIRRTATLFMCELNQRS